MRKLNVLCAIVGLAFLGSFFPGMAMLYGMFVTRTTDVHQADVAFGLIVISLPCLLLFLGLDRARTDEVYRQIRK